MVDSYTSDIKVPSEPTLTFREMPADYGNRVLKVYRQYTDPENWECIEIKEQAFIPNGQPCPVTWKRSVNGAVSECSLWDLVSSISGEVRNGC